MKTAIKMFPGYGWIDTRRSKIAKIRAFRGDYFDFSRKKLKNYFSTHFVALISILAPKIMED
jgi:hypothetical protein